MKTFALILALFVGATSAFIIVPNSQRPVLMVNPTDFVEVDYDGEFKCSNG